MRRWLPPVMATLARARGALAQRAGKRVHGGWRGILSVAFLAAFVASFALAGFSYMFCLSVGRVQTVCCCHAARSAVETLGSERQGPSLDRAPCCETRHFAAAQASSSVPRDPAPAIGAPPVVLAAEITPSVPVFVPRALPVISLERPLPLGRAPPPAAVHLQTVRLLC